MRLNAETGAQNLRDMFRRADRVDLEEGKLAYFRYNALMNSIADFYGLDVEPVVAAFVAMSPNNDYDNNLRSLISMIIGYKEGKSAANIRTSSFNHCRDRAYSYISGSASFLQEADGLKIRSFYHNILHPDNNTFVTVDGHVNAVWLGGLEKMTMKEALLRSKAQYLLIERQIKSLAFQAYLLPHQYQATIWFTRKRLLRIKANPQMDLLLGNDQWRTMRNVWEIKPYAH